MAGKGRRGRGEEGGERRLLVGLVLVVISPCYRLGICDRMAFLLSFCLLNRIILLFFFCIIVILVKCEFSLCTHLVLVFYLLILIMHIHILSHFPFSHSVHQSIILHTC